MTRLVRAEFLKLRTTQVWFWLLLGTVAVSALLVIAQVAPSDGINASSDVPDMFTSSSQAYVVVFVLGVLGVTTEFRYQTITPTFLQTPSRWAIITAKLITYAAVGVVYSIISVLVQIIIAVPWLSGRDISVDFGDGDVQHAIIGVVVVVALFGIVGLGVGALLRNQIVAIVVGIIFLVVLENLLLAIPGLREAWPFTPAGASAAIEHTTGSTQVVDDVHITSTPVGVIVLLLWAFVPAVLGAAFSMNRDIT